MCSEEGWGRKSDVACMGCVHTEFYVVLDAFPIVFGSLALLEEL